jgi:hypothetical protein
MDGEFFLVAPLTYPGMVEERAINKISKTPIVDG